MLLREVQYLEIVKGMAVDSCDCGFPRHLHQLSGALANLHAVQIKPAVQYSVSATQALIKATQALILARQ